MDTAMNYEKSEKYRSNPGSVVLASSMRTYLTRTGIISNSYNEIFEA